MSILSDLQESAERSKQLADESAQNTRQLQTGLQPARAAISALEAQQTSQFNAISTQTDNARPPLGAAIEAAQAARDSQFHSLAEQGNLSAGLPASSPQAK